MNEEITHYARNGILGQASPKTVKGEKYGYLTGIIYLAPVDSAGVGVNVCPMASAGCAKACLFTAGKGGMDTIRAARVRKTRFLFNHKKAFMAQLVVDIAKLKRQAKRKGLRPVVRLNGTSDLKVENWRHEGVRIMDLFPDVQFYDYTKVPKRVLRYLAGDMPRNYHLTFSLAEDNAPVAKRLLKAGATVAAVFRSPAIKEQYMRSGYLGATVNDQDLNDLTFLAKPGVLGLYAKGKARKDTSGFVID